MKLERKILTPVFVLFALIFLGTVHLTPYPLSFLVKAVPVFSMALWVWTGATSNKERLIGIGLIFSGLGDVVLELSGKGFFVYGLGLFLVAHLFYIFAFAKNPKLTKNRSVIALTILAYGAGMGILLAENLGTMTVPVLAYLMVIVIMGVSAVLGSANPMLLVLGAGLFILSDSLIAVNRFLTPIPAAGFWIMITYYPAQLLIARGIVATHE
ncbi:MAG: lysoplasmalogenase [Desulfobacterales bacterium]|nr:lysoplasmalogenase [Desulfobacterales bacterium]